EIGAAGVEGDGEIAQPAGEIGAQLVDGQVEDRPRGAPRRRRRSAGAVEIEFDRQQPRLAGGQTQLQAAVAFGDCRRVHSFSLTQPRPGPTGQPSPERLNRAPAIIKTIRPYASESL